MKIVVCMFEIDQNVRMNDKILDYYFRLRRLQCNVFCRMM